MTPRAIRNCPRCIHRAFPKNLQWRLLPLLRIEVLYQSTANPHGPSSVAIVRTTRLAVVSITEIVFDRLLAA